jgi:hypothetical protein
MQDMETRMNNRVEANVVVSLNLRGTLFVVDTYYLDIFFRTIIYSDPDPNIRVHYFNDCSFEGFDPIVSAMRVG